MLSKCLRKSAFHSFTQRPSFNIATHIQVNDAISSFEYLKEYFEFTEYYIPIMITASAIRLLQIPTYWLAKRISLKMQNLRKKRKMRDNQFSAFTNTVTEGETFVPITTKLFINDLYIDVKQRKMNQLDLRYFKSFYSNELLLSYLVQMHLVINNLKAIQMFELSKGMNVDLILPSEIFLLVFVSNYYVLKASNHPYLINVSKTKYVYVSFFFSLSALFFSKYSCLAWVAYNVTHCLISVTYKLMLKRQTDSKSIQTYFLNRKEEFLELRKKLKL